MDGFSDLMWHYVSKQSHTAGKELIVKKIFTNHEILAVTSFQHNYILYVNVSVVEFQYFGY